MYAQPKHRTIVDPFATVGSTGVGIIDVGLTNLIGNGEDPVPLICHVEAGKSEALHQFRGILIDADELKSLLSTDPFAMVTIDSNNLNTKLVPFGDMGTGKSSLILHFVKGDFLEFQECYHSLTPMYYSSATAAIIVYDITSIKSFERAKKCVQELKKQGNPNMVTSLAENKAALDEKWKVTTEEAQTYAEENVLFFMETSAKTTTNVNDIFYEIERRLPRAQLASPANPDSSSDPHRDLFLVPIYLCLLKLITVHRVCRPFHDTIAEDVLLWRHDTVELTLSRRLSDDALIRITSHADGMLVSLALWDCHNINDIGLLLVVDQNPAITKLCVTGCSNLTVRCEECGGCMDLKELEEATCSVELISKIHQYHHVIGGVINPNAANIENMSEEMNKLINELNLSKDEEEKAKKAMEGLVSTLYEVSSKARETQEKLLAKQVELEDAKAHIEELKLALENTKERYEVMLDEARYEIVCLRNFAERSETKSKTSRSEWDGQLPYYLYNYRTRSGKTEEDDFERYISSKKTMEINLENSIMEEPRKQVATDKKDEIHHMVSVDVADTKMPPLEEDARQRFLCLAATPT